MPSDFIFDLVSHPWFQRLRNIRQLGLSHYVYPGAVHSRFQHSLGAMYLTGQAIHTLRIKGIAISPAEEEAVLVAILLHDAGHGPFSHALEHSLIENMPHELMSLLIMEEINRKTGGRLDDAIAVFLGEYPRKFFHDLVTGQMDMDRMDYLRRDSFFTGVIEGSVGSDRIIRMLNVSDDRLVVDEKGIYSVEKFLIARRMMYWQVYNHRTVVSAEKLLTSLLLRARQVTAAGLSLFATRMTWRTEKRTPQTWCGISHLWMRVTYCQPQKYGWSAKTGFWLICADALSTGISWVLSFRGSHLKGRGLRRLPPWRRRC